MIHNINLPNPLSEFISYYHRITIFIQSVKYFHYIRMALLISFPICLAQIFSDRFYQV